MILARQEKPILRMWTFVSVREATKTSDDVLLQNAKSKNLKRRFLISIDTVG